MVANNKNIVDQYLKGKMIGMIMETLKNDGSMTVNQLMKVFSLKESVALEVLLKDLLSWELIECAKKARKYGLTELGRGLAVYLQS